MHDVLGSLGEAHSEEIRGASPEGEGAEHADDVEGAVDVCVQPGDVVVGDNRVLHGTRRNTTDERRTVITLWFHPHYDKLPQRVTQDMVEKSHAHYSSPIYFGEGAGGWSEAALASAAPLLPEMDNSPHALLTPQEHRAGADDHSLDGYDRSPRLYRMQGGV
jgi:ectoine hydroxylase-related dioxygenase (phytanoyl-CoA dioxygenase family)